MNYSEILHELEQASLFDIYRLKVALDNLLDHPEKLRAVKQKLRVGMDISYFCSDTNQLVYMVVEEVRRTSVCAREKSNGKRWRVYFYAINISNINTDIHAQSTREKLDRNKLHVGETICFLGKNGLSRISCGNGIECLQGVLNQITTNLKLIFLKN